MQLRKEEDLIEQDAGSINHRGKEQTTRDAGESTANTYPHRSMKVFFQTPIATWVHQRKI